MWENVWGWDEVRLVSMRENVWGWDEVRFVSMWKLTLPHPNPQCPTRSSLLILLMN